MVGTTRRVDHVRGVSCADRIARVLPALWASAALAAYFGAPAPVAAQPVPLSDELIVNTYTSGNQRMAELSADANGNFVIVWRSDTSPLEAAPSIRAQRFDAAAAVIGTEFEVAAPGVSPSTPGVAMTADGDFMVVWLEDEPRILARSFDADAMPRSDAFRDRKSVV